MTTEFKKKSSDHFESNSNLFQRNMVLPSYIVIPCVASIPNVWIILAKYLFEPNSKVIYMNFQNLLIYLIKQLCEYAFIACTHYWFLYYLVTKPKNPKRKIFIDLLYYGIYFEIFGFSLYDFEFSRNNLQIALPSLYYAYAGRYGQSSTNTFSEPLYRIPNPSGSISTSHSIISDTIKDAPLFWIFTIVIILSWILVQLILLFVYRDIIFNPVKFYSIDYVMKNKVTDEVSFNLLDSYNCEKECTNLIPYVMHALALIHLVLTIDLYFIPSNFKMGRYLTLPYLDSMLVSMFHFESKLPRRTKREFLSLTRSYLPPDRMWLDTRKNPVYPEVHADPITYCAYNRQDEKCRGVKQIPPQKVVKQLPNVVLLVYESLTPSYYQINRDFIVEHAHAQKDDAKKILTKTSYYNEEIAPNLNKFAKYGITFSGMSSLGLPTASGWHALMTGLSPSQTFTNNVEGAKIHSDDFPSNLRERGYRSFYVSSSLFNFDGSNNFVDRKSAIEEAKNILHCKDGFGDLYDEKSMRQMIPENVYPVLRDCSEKEVEKLAKQLKKRKLDLPKPFDYSFSYQPSPENAVHLGIDPNTLNRKSHWPSDRITAAEVVYHWKQQKDFMLKKNITKPIFGAHLSIEGHIPYGERDLHEFYEDPRQYDYLFNGFSDADRERGRKYIKVSKAADKWQIGYILDWLQKNDNNTIFIITGDHGTRDIPLHDVESRVYDDVVFSGDCVHKSSGSDSFFVTSGVIGYLGDDPVIKERMYFNELAGKTLKIPADHNDLIYTIEDFISELNGTSTPPTHRRSRNLIHLTKEISDKLKTESTKQVYDYIDQMNWRSFSAVSYVAEYREGTTLLRTNPSATHEAHLYNHTSYPNCMKVKGEKDQVLGTEESQIYFQRMKKYIQAETYLNYHNRIYNYAFRDTSCVEKGVCEFPKPDAIRFNYIFIYALTVPPIVIMLVGSLLGKIISSLLTVLGHYNYHKRSSDESILCEA